MGIQQDEGGILIVLERKSVVGRMERSEIRRHSVSLASRRSRIIPLSVGFVLVVSEGLYPRYFSGLPRECL